MSFLIDTNVISELRRPRQAEQRVLDWFSVTEVGLTYISAITLAELEYGAALADVQSKPHAALLRRWIDETVLPGFAGRILPFEETVAMRFGRLQAPEPRPYADVIIAATAQVYGLTLVTRNTRHFLNFGIPIINPWDIS